MEMIRLGTTGLTVSRFGLGTATFGGQCDEETSFSILDRSASIGVNFIDTADKYPLGSSFESAGITESIIGKWLGRRRDDFVLMTKVHGPTGPNPWDRGLSRRHIASAIDASLRRLQTDFIDIYQLHRPDPDTPIEETLGILTDLVHVGKIRYIGCSNFLAYQLAWALGKSGSLHLEAFASVQTRYNLLSRECERELLPFCAQEGIGVVAYNLLAGGLLTGKHDPTKGPAAGSRFATTGASALYTKRYWDDRKLAVVAEIGTISDDLGITSVELSAAWLLARPARVIPLLGATRPEHVEVPVRALGIVLPGETIDRLDELTLEFRQGDSAD